MNPSPWINFVLYAVSGHTDIADKIFQDYESDVRLFSKLLRKSLGVPYVEMYRGLLLDEHEICDGKLKSHEAMNFISWSAKMSVAQNFANPNHFLSSFLKSRKPNSQGYLSISDTNQHEVFFVYEWRLGLKFLGLDLVVAAQDHPDIDEQAFAHCLFEQHEIITCQPDYLEVSLVT